MVRFLAGALYAFASSKLFYAALGQGNIASSQWAPFAALYIVRTVRPGGKARDAALAALFLALQAYAEMTYASFLLVFAGLAFVWGGVDPFAAKAKTGSDIATPHASRHHALRSTIHVSRCALCSRHHPPPRQHAA